MPRFRACWEGQTRLSSPEVNKGPDFGVPGQEGGI